MAEDPVRPVVGLDGRAVRKLGEHAEVSRQCEESDLDATALVQPERVRDSWSNGLSLREVSSPDARDGFRRAQRGAILAVLAHWSTGSTAPATVVLPTGTGKTETMLALLVEASLERLLVIVPSDALRSQIADKFESLGLLPDLGVLPPGARKPSVARLTGAIRSVDDADELLKLSQVVISTPNALAATDPSIRSHFLDAFSTLFFDEAHHVAARTWSAIRDAFEGKPVVQFTATPFREDGHHLQGKVIYAFPLAEARKDGVFSIINYVSVFDLATPDEAIARAAIAALSKDLDQGLDHLLMARCSTRVESEKIHALYRNLAPHLSPVVLHSGMSQKRQKAALAEVRGRHSRIIVCVDMLGEGFDLPQLKVAALHDPRQSLGPTLQLVGRFARVAAGTGEATVIAGRDEKPMDRRLSRLYIEDADWNELIAELSHEAVRAQEEVSEFESGFGASGTVTATRAVMPKMSTVVYKTRCDDWRPEAITTVIPVNDLVTQPIPLNKSAAVVWFVTRSRSSVEWIDGPSAEDVVHDLHVLHWDKDSSLLFINQSANDGVSKELAEAVAGEDAKLIKGDEVFRALGGMTRPIPTNVGVLDIYSHARRFSMYAGTNVTEGFEPVEEAKKVQTNVFAHGFRNGDRETLGVSLKGRIWSYRAAANIHDWVRWCQELGRRLLDPSIDIEEIKRNFIRPIVLDAWPDATPLAAEWPASLLLSPPQSLSVQYQGESVPFFELELGVAHELTDLGALRVTLSTEKFSVAYDISVTEADGMIARVVGADLEFTTSQSAISGSAFLDRRGIVVIFGGDQITYPPGVLFKANRDVEPIDRSELAVTDWSGVPLGQESRGQEKNENTVQGRCLELLKQEDWEVIIDDDGAGEVADLVALRRTDDGHLDIKLVHAKYSASSKPGARVRDLYEVCGQAQRSATWRRHPADMIQKLVKRERIRIGNDRLSGFERGDASTLIRILGDVPLLQTRLEVVIAQPGLSRANASTDQLELLGAARTYIRDTSDGQVTIMCSA